MKRSGSIYEIIFDEPLEAAWTDWFDGLSIAALEGGTRLRGEVADQAALFGILEKVRNLNLTLISVRRCEPVNPSDPNLEEI
jgi:hypothetical protein